jgi:integrase
VTTSGAKSWRYDYRLAGGRETLTIGLYPDVSLTDARDALLAARRLVARGVSPARAKQETRAKARTARANTDQAFGQKWYDAKAPHRSKSWCDNAKRWLEQDIYPALGNKPIGEITPDEIERLVRRVAEKRGAKSGHLARLIFAQVFKSVPRDLHVGNPARDIGSVVELPKPKPKGRPLTVKEIPTFLGAIDRYPARPSTKLATKLLMLTFVRKMELIEAPWDEIDLKGAEWVITAERMNMDKPHIVPLSRQAVACFERLQELACGSPFVFPNNSDPRRPMGASTLNVLFDRAGWKGRFTPHGMRSTASTGLNAQGWPGDAIERQLAHTERDLVRAAYNHADFLNERRRMMQSWADYLDSLCSGADVTPMRKRPA